MRSYTSPYRVPGRLGKTAPQTARKPSYMKPLARKAAKTSEMKKYPSPTDSNHRFTSLDDGDAERTSISPTNGDLNLTNPDLNTSTDFEMTQSSIFQKIFNETKRT